jgi:hypothetical protein
VSISSQRWDCSAAILRHILEELGIWEEKTPVERFLSITYKVHLAKIIQEPS